MDKNVPGFVVWHDVYIIEACRRIVFERYGFEGFNSRSIECHKMPLQELRELATVVCEFGLCRDFHDNIPYDNQKWITDQLNAEFDRRIPHIQPMYDMLIKKFERDRMEGFDFRYRLLSLHSRKGYVEMSVLKNSVWLFNLMEKLLTISIVEELDYILTSILPCEFGHEIENVNASESKENFEMCNNARKKEIEAQNDFIDAVFDDRLMTAYSKIKDQIDCMMNPKT